jgi:predicted TIM-barrel fold metal-dependent hydrolase
MIIDAHVHVFPQEFIEKRSEYVSLDPTFAELYSQPNTKMVTADELLKYMDQSGTDKAIVQAIGWGTNRLCHIHNEYMAEINARYSERLISLGCFNPKDQSGAENELKFCHEAGLKGIGELRADKQGFNLTDKDLLYPFMRFMWKNNMFLSLHCSEPVGHSYSGKGSVWPQDIYLFLQNFPELKTILAHFGGGLCLYGLMPEVKETLKNAVVDCAAQPYLYDKKIYQTTANILGEEKIVYGSDYPLLTLGRYQEQMNDLPQQLQEKLLGGNIVQFMS